MIYIMGMDIFGRKRIKHLESVIESLGKRLDATMTTESFREVAEQNLRALNQRDDMLSERLDAVEKAAVVSSIELDAREMIGKIQPQTTEDGLTNYRGMIREAWELARAWDIERKRGA